MSGERPAQVAIVDYGLGNLYSVGSACEFVGLRAAITADPGAIRAADAVILPGVGAYADAMQTLRTLGLVPVIREVAASSRPLVGICLGMQLLMTESEEFGRHEGLGIVEGRVVRFPDPRRGQRALKVPQIGWNAIDAALAADRSPVDWRGTLLEGVAPGERMYFVHSYIVCPAHTGVSLATTTYGDVTFTSALRQGNIIACQFHPERSGQEGLRIYRNLARMIAAAPEESIRESVI